MTQPSYVALVLAKAWQRAWNSRSAPGSIAQIASCVVAGVITYWAATPGQRGGVVLAVVAAVVASLIVLGVIGATRLVMAQKALYEEVREERDKATTALSFLLRPPEVKVDFREIESDDGVPLIWLGIKNAGGTTLDDAQVSILYPRSWKDFYGCDAQGLGFVPGGRVPSDENLPGAVDAYLAGFPLRPIKGGGTTLLFFRFKAPPGDHQLAIHVAGLREIRSVTVPPADEIAIS